MACAKFRPSHSSRQKMPGQYGASDGYVYAILGAAHHVKIGTSCNPRCRLNEIAGSSHYGFGAYRHSNLRAIRCFIVSGAHASFRAIEQELHRLLKPWQLNHHRSESYQLPKLVEQSLLAAFQSDFSLQALAELEASVVGVQQEAA